MSGLPSLGPRGEGWVALQFACLALVAAGCLLPPHTAGLLEGSGLIAVSLVLVLVGGIAMVSGSYMLHAGDAFTAVPHPKAEGSLVDTGPYAYVRHPIYSGLILMCLGAAISQSSGPAIVATLALAIVLDLKRRREEAWLEDRYPGYAAYRARTKALIPFVY